MIFPNDMGISYSFDMGIFFSQVGKRFRTPRNYKDSYNVSFHNCRLYVANAGNSRALLCRTDPEEEGGTLRVFQLSLDHNLNNEEECKR